MTVTVGSDDSLFINEAIKKVYETLAEAAVLVVFVIFLFLGSWRATLIPAVTVPICLLGAFATLWIFGFSINLLTLLALVLCIGIVVDDAIVVLENIYHRIEEGEPPLAAAYNGARQVGFAVISMTLVVCAVFVPVMFISGQTGLLFRELAVAMIGAIAFSGFLALSLAPMLCSKLLKHEERGRFASWVDRRIKRLEAAYASRLDKVLVKPRVAIIGVAGLLVGAGLLFATLESELAPTEDVGIMSANISAPEGTGYAAMDRYMLDAQAQLLPLLDEGAVRTVIARDARRLRRQRRFQQRLFHTFPQTLGRAGEEYARRSRRGQSQARRPARGAWQCVGSIVIEPGPRPADQLHHRRIDL